MICRAANRTHLLKGPFFFTLPGLHSLKLEMVMFMRPSSEKPNGSATRISDLHQLKRQIRNQGQLGAKRNEHS